MFDSGTNANDLTASIIVSQVYICFVVLVIATVLSDCSPWDVLRTWLTVRSWQSMQLSIQNPLRFVLQSNNNILWVTEYTWRVDANSKLLWQYYIPS